MTESVSDHEFLRHLEDKNWKAIEFTVREYTGILIKGGMKFGLTKIQAEEVIQNVWVTFFEVIPKFQGRSSIKTFLYGILVNKVREFRREQDRPIDNVSQFETEDNLFDENGHWATPPLNPEEFANASQVMDIIQSCLERLPSSQRQVFVLREIESENNSSVCNILSLTDTHVRVLLNRAKNGLRRCIEKSYLRQKTEV